MRSSSTDQVRARATEVTLAADALTFHLADGRAVSVPLAWFPRLLNGSPLERSRWELIGDGEGVHWPELDEDISVEGVLEGRPSAESPQSLERWLRSRSMP